MHPPSSASPARPAHPARPGRRLARGLWWPLALYAATIAALTLLPGWLMLR